tara:strand:+ start:689 stop:1129 length:441 start_codon:yes stop_codon:yes gene_type:complete
MKDIQTGLIFSPIPKDYASAIWPNVARVLEKSVFTAKGKYEVDDVLDCILKDELVLWVVIDTADDEVVAAITTRLIEYPQGNAMAMDWIGGTRMKEWLSMAQESISRYARDHKCKYLEGYGRKGWDRWLRKYGWKPDYIAYKMELN